MLSSMSAGTMSKSRWIFFLVFLFPIACSIFSGSVYYVTRTSCALVFVFGFMTGLSFLLPNADSSGPALIGLVVGSIVIAYLLPDLLMNDVWAVVMRVLGLVWMFIQGVIMIDVIHHFHFFLVWTANIGHKRLGCMYAARWYGLHLFLSVASAVCCVIALYSYGSSGGAELVFCDWLEWLQTIAVVVMVLVSLLPSVNKGLMIPAFIGLYTSCMCWSIRLSSEPTVYDTNSYLTCFLVLLFGICVLYGVVERRSTTLWYFLVVVLGSVVTPFQQRFMSTRRLSIGALFSKIWEDIKKILRINTTSEHAHPPVVPHSPVPATDGREDEEESAGLLDVELGMPDGVSSAVSRARTAPKDTLERCRFHLTLACAASYAPYIADNWDDAEVPAPQWVYLEAIAMVAVIGLYYISMVRSYGVQKVLNSF